MPPPRIWTDRRPSSAVAAKGIFGPTSKTRQMVVRLVAVVFFAVTVFVLTVAGAVIAVLTGIGLLNVFVVVVGMSLRRPTQVPNPRRERWQPSSFRRPPRPPQESEEPAREVTARRQ